MVTMTRPNGKQYRSRSQPKAHVLLTDGGTVDAVIVLPTDDLELAASEAVAELEYRFGDRWRVSRPVFTWWRESMRDHDSYWSENLVAGAPGYMFDAEEI